MGARDHDRHRVAVEYRTAKMACKDAEHLRKCGWQVRTFGDGINLDEPKTIYVDTYKPESLFGEHGVIYDRSTWRGQDLWERGIVRWSLACGCPPEHLSDDSSHQGIHVRLQPTGKDGRVYFPADDYTIERISWPCRLRDNRASVAVRKPEDEGWRGRMVMVDVGALLTALAHDAGMRWTRDETIGGYSRRDADGRNRGNVWRFGPGYGGTWRYTGLGISEPGVATMREARALCVDPLAKTHANYDRSKGYA